MAQVEVFPGEFGEVLLLIGDHLDQAGVRVDRSLVPVPLLAVDAVHQRTAAGVAAAVGGGERQGEVPDGQGGGAGARTRTGVGAGTARRRELPLEPTIDVDDFLHRLQAHLHDVSHHSRHQERPSVIAPWRPCHARFHSADRPPRGFPTRASGPPPVPSTARNGTARESPRGPQLPPRTAPLWVSGPHRGAVMSVVLASLGVVLPRPGPVLRSHDRKVGRGSPTRTGRRGRPVGRGRGRPVSSSPGWCASWRSVERRTTAPLSRRWRARRRPGP